MALALRENFARGTLASDLTAVAVQLTMNVGHTLPTAVGSFPLVIWDQISYPDPADDIHLEIVTASYSGTPNVYDIVRAQEDTVAVVHGSGDRVALHYTAQMSLDDLADHEHSTSSIVSGTFADPRISESSVTQHQGAIDHGSIAGLGGDDHALYHTDGRAATWLANNHETTYTHTDIALNTTHRGYTSGNPHSVTPTELGLVIGTDVQAHGDVLDDLNTLGAPASDGQFIVATGAGAFAYESTTTARTSLGVGTGDSPTFAGLVIADGGTVGQAAGPLLTFNDTSDYLGVTGCNVGIGTTSPNTKLHIYTDVRNSLLTEMIKMEVEDKVTGWLDYFIFKLGATSARGGGIVFGEIGGPFPEAGLNFELNKTRIYQEGNYPLYLETNSIKRMTILGDGNVGIGIDTPIEKFHLQKGSNTIAFTPNRRTIAIFEGANADGAVVDIVGADTADTVGISMGKASSETIGRVVYDFDNDRLALGVSGDSNFFVLTGGVGTIRAGIHETAPETILEITHTEPYLTLHNSTEEDSDGGRESRIIARGEQSGEEESILGWLEFSHDGAANDQNGQLRVYINDGDDGTSPTLRTKWGYDGSLYHGDGTNQAVIDAAGVITLEGSAKRILTLRPELNNQEIINRTVPEYEVIGAGVVFGYGLPLWNVADGGDLLSHQELHFKENVPGRWDGASDIEFHVRVCLAGAEDVDDKFKFQFSWNQTGETDLVPVVTHDTTDEITVVDGTQYATYDLVFTIDYNIDGGDAIIAHDLLSGRLRRVAASANECDNEIIVLEWHSHYVVDKMFKAP